MTDLIAALRAPGRPSVWWLLRDRLSISCFHLSYAIRCCIPVYGKVLRARQLAEECAEQRYGNPGWDAQRLAVRAGRMVRPPQEAAGSAYPRLRLVGQVPPAAEPERPLATVIPMPARSGIARI